MKSLLSEIAKGNVTFETVEYQRRNVLISLLTMVGLTTLFFFAFYLFVVGSYLFAALDLLAFITISFLHLQARKKNDYRISIQLELLLIGLLFLYIMGASSVDSGAWAWSTIYPLIVLFTLGKKGLFYAVGFLVLSLTCVYLRMQSLFNQEAYSMTLISRYLFIYGLNFALAALIEKVWQESLEILKGLHERLKGVTMSLSKAKQEVEDLSLHDPLTGLYNRRYFDTILHDISRISTRELSGLGIMMIDIDHFKKVNDTFGHCVGDKALIEVSSAINRVVRRQADMLFRYGGEEFILLLYGPSKEQMNILANDIRYEVTKPFLVPEKQRLSVSIGGVLWLPGASITIEEYVDLADKAMYKSKEQGRDRYTFIDTSNEIKEVPQKKSAT